MKRLFLLVFILSISTACQDSSDNNPTENISVAESEATPELLPLVEGKTIKNIIFLIGDGTGIAQLTSGQYATVGSDGLLHVQTMPVTGIVKTHSSDNLITDSASGATAYSCGLKTYNGAIGVNPDKTPCKTILELAEEKGLSTGLVSTSSITHATPASFAAHVESRSMEDEIAAQFLNSGVEVLLGGGVEYFSSEDRSDSRDLISEFSDKGYQVLLNADDLNNSTSDKLLGLFASDGLERAEGEPSTAAMTSKALEILNKNEKGFFLMVEGSQIDWGGHGNSADYVINEVQDFDAAVKAALDFAQEDGETLVVVTADHETGGMTLQRQTADGDSLEIYWTTGYHTGTPVPLMAYGPNATEFMGWRDNTYVGKKLAELLQVGNLPILLEN
ncbi:MAG: alkaline phosphatase [Balneola sp.]|nr:alkaline phosphatase [Balneola sp.]MBE79674.1 alkaline phosphatase [Balneola sp.]HBX67082.1 alkaline phosphatase [Balneolaceae bacterium]|tara:strand:+ start:2687 stop:3856 length:1170 start_codon:yes stop_codon:yes gene_type:complete